VVVLDSLLIPNIRRGGLSVSIYLIISISGKDVTICACVC
jgi:hypothetical protein